MAQHDYVLDNGPGASVRADMNGALAAVVSQNSGPVEPPTTFAYQLWLDTGVSPNVLRQRNGANSGWETPTIVSGKQDDIPIGSIAEYYRGDKQWATLDKAAVGLGAVDNVADANKPVSTPQQTALNSKMGIGGGTFTGTVEAPAFYVTAAVPIIYFLEPSVALRPLFMDNAVMYINNAAASINTMVHDNAGNTTFAGNVAAYSDARLKEDVETIAGALELVRAMRGVRYTRTDDKSRGVGVIAQEVISVVPEVVRQEPNSDIYSVAYGNLVGVLIEAVKELAAQVDELKEKLP